MLSMPVTNLSDGGKVVVFRDGEYKNNRRYFIKSLDIEQKVLR